MEMSDETLLNHFHLLQQQFQKLNSKYQALQQKYNDLLFCSNSLSQDNNFSSNLLRTIKSLYNDKKYSDISIKLQRTMIPGHKIVLEAHCGEWGQSNLCFLNEINLEDVDQSIGEQVVRWLYTQEMKDNQKADDLWKIVEIAHNFNLINLKARCQDSLTSTVTMENCIYFYKKSCELLVEDLQKYCMDLIIANWINYKPSEFNMLGASIMLDLLEVQSNYPLHTAVKYDRDDVVFLYINDNFSQLEEFVNIVSDKNEIVLDLALISKRIELCQTLLNNCANLNLVDNEGWSLLHKAIQRRDKFSAKFLIENRCHLNPLSPILLQTPLQLIAKMKPCEEDPEVLKDMNEVASLIVMLDASINHADVNDMTAICLAILSDNEKVLKVILESGRCTDINGTNTFCANKTKTLTNSPQSNRNMLPGVLPPHPLWLAICREYRQELLFKYSDFSDVSIVETSPTLLLVDHGADPNCIFDLESGNSIFLEMVSQQMEDAAIFILKSLQQKSLTSISLDRKSPIESLLTLTNNSKETPLHIAVEKELLNLSRLLLKLGADANAIRRKLLQSPNNTVAEELCSSLESITSLSLNNIPEELSGKNSPGSDSLSSCCSNKAADLNPFKEYLIQESKIETTPASQPLIRKPNINRSSLFESVLNNNQQKDYLSNSIYKSKSKSKSKRTTNEVTVDLCSPTHLAIRSRNMEIITLFLEHDGTDGNNIDWLLCDYNDESPFTLSLWSGLITVADKIFSKMARKEIRASKIDQILVEEHGLMHQAVLKNNIDAVQFLIKIGCNINLKSSSGATPLQIAIDKGSLDIVKILCLAGGDPNVSYQCNVSEVNKDRICPLWAALKCNRFDIAEILAENGSEVDMWFMDPRDQYEQTLLHKAILEKNEDASVFLINHDCNINSPRESKLSNNTISSIKYSQEYVDGSTPLHLACQYGLTQVVRSLLSRKDIIMNAQNSQGSTALHIAIQYEKEDIFPLLMNPKMKLNLSLRDQEGHTAFHVAMGMSNQVVASTILRLEPTVADEVDNLGRNFLHVAIQTMNREAMFFLIQIDVDLNVRVKDCLQHTPLQLAVISGVPEDMIRSLILAGARVEEYTVEKQNLLHLAVIYGRTYLINCLIENGTLISHQDHNLDTPLHLAVKIGNKDMIEQLLKNSSKSIKIKNLKGETILHTLANNAKENDVVIFSLLMDLFKDFPINECDAGGNTALFLAVFHGHVKLAVAILLKGGSLGCVNNDGVSLFNCNQISERILIKLLDSLDSEPQWLDGEICVSCISKFTIKNRKHHCRHCGRLVCGKCSSNEIPIVRYGITKPVRVCETCFNFIVNGKIK